MPHSLTPAEIHINADRRLVFQVVSAYGNQGLDGYETEVLEDHGDRKLVRFVTPLKALGMTRQVETVEWVDLREPERIDFTLVPDTASRSPIALKALADAFVLTADDGCTTMRYESRFEPAMPVIGDAIARLLIRPVMSRHMRDHLHDVKQLCETRAARSRLFPQQPCTHRQARATLD